MANGQTYDLRDDMVRTSLYRRFFKQSVAFDRTLNDQTYRLPSLYPTPDSENIGISIVGTGTTVPFVCLATDMLPEVQLLSNSDYHARWRYENAPLPPTLPGTPPAGRVSNINPEALARFRAALGD